MHTLCSAQKLLLQSPNNTSPNFAHSFESKVGRGLYSNIWLDQTICPHKCADVVKSHDDLAVAIQRNSNNIGHAPRESSQVCLNFLQKSGSEKTCSHSVVTGDEGRLGNLYVCLCLQGTTKTLFAELKAYFKNVLQTIYRLLYTTYFFTAHILEIFQKTLLMGHSYETNLPM